MGKPAATPCALWACVDRGTSSTQTDSQAVYVCAVCPQKRTRPSQVHYNGRGGYGLAKACTHPSTTCTPSPTQLNGTKWQGVTLRIERARPDYLTKLQGAWEEDAAGDDAAGGSDDGIPLATFPLHIARPRKRHKVCTVFANVCTSSRASIDGCIMHTSMSLCTHKFHQATRHHPHKHTTHAHTRTSNTNPHSRYWSQSKAPVPKPPTLHRLLSSLLTACGAVLMGVACLPHPPPVRIIMQGRHHIIMMQGRYLVKTHKTAMQGPTL